MSEWVSFSRLDLRSGACGNKWILRLGPIYDVFDTCFPMLCFPVSLSGSGQSVVGGMQTASGTSAPHARRLATLRTSVARSPAAQTFSRPVRGFLFACFIDLYPIIGHESHSIPTPPFFLFRFSFSPGSVPSADLFELPLVRCVACARPMGYDEAVAVTTTGGMGCVCPCFAVP